MLVRGDDFFIAMLRFEAGGRSKSIRGRTTRTHVHRRREFDEVAGERAQIHAGELVRWPKVVPHRLWTDVTQMTTLMYERT